MHHLDHDIDEFDEDYVSKTDVKRYMHELQDLALTIIRLPKAKRNKLPLNEELQDAMVLGDKILNKPDALKRHSRFVAKLLAETDVDAIRAEMDVLANKHQQQSKQHEKFEQLREQVIAGGNQEVEDLLALCPGMERQKLRQLVRQATKEQANNKPGKSYRDLLAYIKANYQE
ncbi:DUF615 domain-containing protein [Thalassotalea euphylliae]|uniref:Dual-action ribosomal maturation protein DarP n=1 Tax=Thalassotalea euphylliae TaxID=1655234 RepID=A0A3E0TMP1_9GAMM|nr:ribosome biogenesis factor YjgA [Thalassotalea euphylliae]REL25663.1 DUF615 domain-containing protein [Thalassotalea euphylliae]